MIVPLQGLYKGKLAPDKLEIMPNSIFYASKRSRPGVLPRMLEEILKTRIMVKSAMKQSPKSAKVLQRCLNARQYGLKMIANVSYGYASAGFSGLRKTQDKNKQYFLSTAGFDITALLGLGSQLRT